MAFTKHSSLGAPSDSNLRSYAMAVSTTITKGDAVYLDADGYLAPAGATTAVNFVGVAVGATTTTGGSDHTQMLVDSDPNAVWEATCTNVTAQDQVGNSHDLTSAAAVANTSSSGTYKIFKMLDPLTIGGYKCLGVFIKHAATE